MSKMILLKATEEARVKLKKLTDLLNNKNQIGKVRQSESIEYAIDVAIKSLENA